jgi:hypothetical protein
MEVRMSWDELFERAARHGVAVAAIDRRLAARRGDDER